MIALDSDFIIHLIKGDECAKMTYYKFENSDFVTTQINFFEVMQGIYNKKKISTKEKNQCLEFFNTINTMDLNSESTLIAAKLSGNLKLKGLILESHDCLIAGILTANNCKTIITRNKKHFSRFKEIKVINY